MRRSQQKKVIPSLMLLIIPLSLHGQQVDYSVVSVPEEDGLSIVKITEDNDYVAMPQVLRNFKGLVWVANKVLDISPIDNDLAYIAAREGGTNIFIRSLEQYGPTIQRTRRRAIMDLSYSPDGKNIVFTEKNGRSYEIYQTDAMLGYVCRQITNGNLDHAPVYSLDKSKVLFSRQEAKSSSIWSFDFKDNFFASYTAGLNPCVLSDNEIICTRTNNGLGEIWRINLSSGIEECIASDLVRSFSSPSVSPDRKWVAFVGSSPLDSGKGVYWNTDIYACRIDGSEISQLTYHAANDLSPVWSRDGRFIYFVSQRGSRDAMANVWRLTFQTE